MINTTSIYGIRAVCYLAGQPEERFVPIREISVEMQIPFQYLTKLLQRLQTGGLIHSRRGNTGGVSLARPSDKITLMDVLAVLEPDIVGKKCLLHDVQNSENHCCEFGTYWQEVQTKINELLSTTSIQWVAEHNSDDVKVLESSTQKKLV